MDIANILGRSNRWWETGRVDAARLPALARAEYIPLIKALSRSSVLALVGPRRMGKTTLVLQAIDHMIAEGVDPKRIFYINAEDPIVRANRFSLADLFSAYVNEVLLEPLAHLEAPLYVLIDEAHLLQGWHSDIKALGDRNAPVHWAVTSSSKAALYKGARLSLLGRVENLHILPLDFLSFCRFFALRSPQVDLSQYLSKIPPQSAFSDPIAYAGALTESLPELAPYKPLVWRALREYLLGGGYPEYDGNLILWQERWLSDLLPGILFYDVLAGGGVKNLDTLPRVLARIAQDNGSSFSFTSLADDMGVDTVTIQGYMAHLQRAFLINLQENHVEVAGKIIRKNKKLTVADNGLLCALLRRVTAEDEADLAVNSVLMAARCFSERELFNLRYWREDPRAIDLVIDMGGSALPVAMAYGTPSPQHEAALKAFAGRFDSPASIMVTKDTLAVKERVAQIPLWLLRA